MSQMSILDALTRISEADPESPVAVFLGSSVSRVDVRFANTVDTRRRILAGDRDLIGIYSRDSARARIMADIQRVRSGRAQGRPSGSAVTHWVASRPERRKFDRRSHIGECSHD